MIVPTEINPKSVPTWRRNPKDLEFRFTINGSKTVSARKTKYTYNAKLYESSPRTRKIIKVSGEPLAKALPSAYTDSVYIRYQM